MKNFSSISSLALGSTLGGLLFLALAASSKTEFTPIPQNLGTKENVISWDTTQFTTPGKIKSGAVVTNLQAVQTTAAQPGFMLDNGLGMYYYSTDVIGFSAQSNNVATISPAGIGSGRFWPSIAGTANEPTFYTDPGTGMFKSATNAIGFATDSTERWMINASGSFNPIVDNQYSIGNGTVNPRNVYASTAFGIGATAAQSGLSTNTFVDALTGNTNQAIFNGGILITNRIGI